MKLFLTFYLGLVELNYIKVVAYVGINAYHPIIRLTVVAAKLRLARPYEK